MVELAKTGNLVCSKCGSNAEMSLSLAGIEHTPLSGEDPPTEPAEVRQGIKRHGLQVLAFQDGVDASTFYKIRTHQQREL